MYTFFGTLCIYVCVYIYIFIHLAVCLTTGPKPLPKRALHIVRSRASSFGCEYPLPSLRLSSSFLRLLPRIPVTYFPPFIFHSITCRRWQFLCNIWPIQLAFRLLISCRIFLCSLILSNTSSFLTCSVQLIFYILLQQSEKYIHIIYCVLRSHKLTCTTFAFWPIRDSWIGLN
jgi:hypothetical protein